MTAEARRCLIDALDALADAGLYLRRAARADGSRDPDVRAIENIEATLEAMLAEDAAEAA